MWHLKVRFPALGLALALVLVLVGCPSSEPSEAPAEVEGPKSGAEIRKVVNALYEQKGEDAYTDPSLDPLLVELEALARNGDKDAATLRGLILAKRRLALRAQSGEKRPKDPNLVRRGPVSYEGDKPTGADGISRAEAVAVGTSRDELKAAYGGCLVRQTWYPARGPGTVTLELFHVAPECRETLSPRVFRVIGGEVTRVTSGDLDRMMQSLREPSPDR